MLNSQEEHILIDYFKTCVVAGDRVDDDKVFDLIMRIHQVEESRARQLKEKCAFAKLNELADLPSCNLYTRTCDFLQMQKRTIPLSKEQQQIIAIKISAIRQLSAQGLCVDKYTTMTTFWRNLETAAKAGIVDALRIGGLLMAEKLVVRNDDGLAWLNMAGSWLDYTSLMYISNVDLPKGLVQYNKNSTLKFACDYYGYSYPKHMAKEFSHTTPAHNAFLLISAVDLNKLSLDKIHPLYHKLIYSPVLSESDKDRLILRGEYAESELSLLPIDIHYNAEGATVLDVHERKFPRKEDLYRIADVCSSKEQNNVFISCDDNDSRDKLSDTIINAHSKSNCGHVATIDVADLQMEDFERSTTNVFLRNLVNGVSNALVLRLEGRVSADVLQQINEFLMDKNHYRLAKPNVVLDLSDVLVYYLCDEQNAKYFSDRVFVDISPMTSEEKMEYIQDMEINACDQMVGKRQLWLTEEMRQWLCRYPLKTVDGIMRELFNSNQCDGFSLEQLKLILSRQNKSKKQNGFGFGGHTI